MNKCTMHLLTGFLLLAQTAFCQYHYYGSYDNMSKQEKTIAKRSYFGINKPLMALNLLQTFQIDRSGVKNSGPSVDTTININKKSPGKIGIKNTIGIIGGTSFKLAQTSETSMIALDVAASVDLYNWSIGKVKYSKNDSIKNDVFVYMASLPLSIMYKSGGETDLTSKNNFLFSIGAGLAPSGCMAAYGDVQGGFFKLRTFLVSEVGVWFGTAVKFRVTYFPGTAPLITFSGNNISGYDPDANITATATGSGNVMFSFIWMINAHLWENSRY